MSNALILLAGGNGSRFGSEKPKQLVALAGKPILEHTLSNVAGCEAVGQIVIVSREEIITDIQKIADQFNSVEIKVVSGGKLGHFRALQDFPPLREARTLKSRFMT